MSVRRFQDEGYGGQVNIRSHSVFHTLIGSFTTYQSRTPSPCCPAWRPDTVSPELTSSTSLKWHFNVGQTSITWLNGHWALVRTRVLMSNSTGIKNKEQIMSEYRKSLAFWPIWLLNSSKTQRRFHVYSYFQIFWPKMIQKNDSKFCTWFEQVVVKL